MKRMLLIAGLLTLGAASPLWAQETAENELELVRQLRLKGWNDFARAKIEQLLNRGDPVLAAALPLEMARVNIAEARQKDPVQRFALFTAARAQLLEYINKNQVKVGAALASAELAHLTSYHAQAILSTAMREEDNKSRHDKARPAEVMFLQAGKDLADAAKAMEAALQAAADTETKAILTGELKQTRFDAAVNIYDQARTYVNRSKIEIDGARSKLMGQAIDSFKKMQDDGTSEAGWLANAWLMKLNMEVQTPDDVNKYHNYIMKWKDDKASQPFIQPAVRLVRYFRLQDVTLNRPDDSDTTGGNATTAKLKLSPLDRLKLVQFEGDAWLKSYPAHHKTYEGQGVLYEVAMAYMIAANLEKDQKVAGPAHLKAALLHFEKLEKIDGDLSERARQMVMSIKFKTLDTKGELSTFEDNLTAAMIERTKVIKISGDMENPKLDDPAKLDAQRKLHLKAVISSLNKALALTTSSTPVAKTDDARFYLCGAYLVSGDPYRAAVVAEALGRARATKRAQEGASTALATYAALSSRSPNDLALRKRLNDMCEFILAEKNWSADPVASLANYHLAMAERDANPKKAIAHLEKLTSDFTDFIYTQGQGAFICEDARRKTEDKKEQSFYLEKAKAFISRMPKYTASDSPSVITMYFYAKGQMSKYMYADAMEELNGKEGLKAIKKCIEMKTYVQGLQADFDKLPGKTISEKNREQLDFEMRIMLKYGDLGIAKAKFRSDAKDRFDEVLTATKTVVDDALQRAAKTPADKLIPMKDYDITGEILSLALRANVQKGDIVKGQAILGVLQRLANEKEEKVSGNAVAVLLNDIGGQIKRMVEEKDSNLKATQGNYELFLGIIAKEYEAKGIDNNAAILLANAYKSLNLHCKAAPMFAKVKAPASIDKVLPKKTGKETDAELAARQIIDDEQNRHWSIQIEYIRALRACKEPESLNTAEKVASDLIANKNSRFQIQAMSEKNLLLEDVQRYREAFLGWQAFMKNPSISGVNLNRPEVQKIYFPAYFNYVRCYYKIATLDPKITDRPKMIASGAKLIVNLEFSKTPEGWNVAGPLFQELFKDKEYEPLKKEYDRQKKERLDLKKGAALPKELRDHFAACGFAFARPHARAKPQAAKSMILGCGTVS
ncbi:MAG: hypothetical protein EXR98_00605 [Gemmataceae bacterium]|nr:hypothetical protein [Gemmataceae bacterium]